MELESAICSHDRKHQEDPDARPRNTLGGYSFFDPSQPKYNLRRQIETDAEGRYRFRSLLPAGYACPPATRARRMARPRSCWTNSAATVTARHISISSSAHPATAS